jgi:CheY-like chemotaxis protein
MLKEAIEKSRSLSHDLSPAVLNMNDLAEVLRWLTNRVREQHGLTVGVDISGVVTLQSEAMTMFLFRAAQEMLFNVVKHARVHEAALRVRRIGRCVCLCVSDRGRGFDPQELKETAGFGLLSIRERVELLGGRMKIKSVIGKGSRFHIVVPDDQKTTGRFKLEVSSMKSFSSALQTSNLTLQTPEGPPSEPRVRVLLADDHKIVRQGLVSLLREASGIEVVGEASNGHEAVNLAYELRPDVLIMDVAMPIMSGEEATRQIKGRLPKIRIVALSMSEEPETIERMHQAGAESYVLKTAPSEELLAAIRGRDAHP